MPVSETTYRQVALELGRIHPFERCIIAGPRPADGGYIESRYTGGSVRRPAIPAAVIDVDAPFA